MRKKAKANNEGRKLCNRNNNSKYILEKDDNSCKKNRKCSTTNHREVGKV